MTRDVVRLFAGPTAWFLAHVASWMLAPPAHQTGGRGAIWGIAAAALAVAVVAGLDAVARLRELDGAAIGDRRAERLERARLFAGAGVALSALSIVLIIGLTLPTFLLVPGAEP